MRLGLRLWGAGLVALTAGYARGQSPAAYQIVSRMMEHNAQRQAMLQHYTSDRTYQLEYNGAAGYHHARMVVHAEYTAPGRKRLTVVSEAGSKVLCHEVLRKLVQSEEETAAKQDWQRTMFSPEAYSLQLLGLDEIDGVSVWVLRVEPKEIGTVAFRGNIWVSADNYATVRMLGEPAKSPSLMLMHPRFDPRYMRRGGIMGAGDECRDDAHPDRRRGYGDDRLRTISRVRDRCGRHGGKGSHKPLAGRGSDRS